MWDIIDRLCFVPSLLCYCWIFFTCQSVSEKDLWVLYFSLIPSEAGVYIFKRPKVTNSVGQSTSWESNSHSASQEIPRLLWNPKVHYHVHKSTALVPILSKMNPVHDFPPYFPKIHPNIILPSTPMTSEWSLPFRFSDQNFLCISHFFQIRYTLYPSHSPCFDHP
jgi:hypothetical protein